MNELGLLLELHERLAQMQSEKLDEADAATDPNEFSDCLSWSRGIGEARSLVMEYVMRITSEQHSVLGD